MAIDHISLYQLTIEDGTAFGDRYSLGKLRGLPDDDDAAKMYEITQDITESAGFETYEVSNHARPGAESRHNTLYWKYGDYIGIGPGAHGRVTLNHQRYATEAVRMPDGWLLAVEGGNGDKIREGLIKDDQATEFLLMGLRLVEGVDLERFRALAGHDVSTSTIAELTDLGMVEVSQSTLRVTPRGRMVLNAVIESLLR